MENTAFLANRRYRLAVIGGGPAGLAPLLAAHRAGRLAELLAGGVVIIEQSGRLGGGTIGNYAINSDSTGTTFADCLKSPIETPLTALRSHPLAREVADAGDGPIALGLAGRFLSLVGDTLCKMIAAHPDCAVLTGHRALRLQKQADGWITTVQGDAGVPGTIASLYVVSATGAHQPRARLEAESVGGANLVAYCGEKLVQSGDVFVTGGLAALAERLKGLPDPRIAVIGGSTSAAAVAHALLHRLPQVSFGHAGVTILHRRELHIYYPSVEAAHAEGYTDFGEDDICPISKRVFRFAGFRLDSRELIMQVRGIGGRRPEPRLKLHRLQTNDPAGLAILNRADVVVAALGYRPNALPVLDMAGEAIELHKERGASAPLVDGHCRIMDVEGAPIPGLFGIGLAAGFVPRGALGGEASFSGQANGLWLWQNDVGMLIVDAVLSDARPVVSEPSLDVAVAPKPAQIPLMRPSPPRLSQAGEQLRQIEDSRIFSNFGPVNTAFEQDLLARMFNGSGACMTVCNATIGLMMAIRHATEQRTANQRYALMPSFTFAATAQAAIWCGLTPLFCDIDAGSWAAAEGSEDALLRRYAGEIAVIVPYATFGYDIDLARYERIWNQHGIPVVVDAAASLGTLAADGRGFGAGFPGSVVFSMHATKSFSTGEGGVIYSADTELIRELRIMANFGFGAPRSATMVGLNAKLSEVSALLAQMRLDGYDDVIVNRDVLVGRYRASMPELTFQFARPRRQAHQFMPALLPAWMAPHRAALQDRLRARGVGSAMYFSPHLAEQPYFAKHGQSGSLGVTQHVADRMISLPLYDGMTLAEVDAVSAAVSFELRAMSMENRTAAKPPAEAEGARTDASMADVAGRSAWHAPLPTSGVDLSGD